MRRLPGLRLLLQTPFQWAMLATGTTYHFDYRLAQA